LNGLLLRRQSRAGDEQRGNRGDRGSMDSHRAGSVMAVALNCSNATPSLLSCATI
jgi:hypothetical protein